MRGVGLPASKLELQLNFIANDSVFHVGSHPGFQSDSEKLQPSQGKIRRPTYDLRLSEGQVKSRGGGSRGICNRPQNGHSPLLCLRLMPDFLSER